MKNKIVLSVLILSMITFVFSGCVNGTTTPNIPNQGGDVNHKPIISDLSVSPRTAFIDQNITITCTASDQDGDTLAYSWSSSPGGTINGIGSKVTWESPATKGIHSITCLVSDGKGGEDSKSIDITVASDSGGVRYSISWSEAESNGWKNPLGEGKELITSTAYDYDSGIYLHNHPGKKHMGIDIVSEKNDKVYAIADGTIRKIVRGSDPGNMVVIIEHTNSNNKDFFAIYGHVFARSDLEVNSSEVKAGENIGIVNKSGSPCHLHFGINLSSKIGDFIFTNSGDQWGWGRIPEFANPSEYDWIDPIDYLNVHGVGNIVSGSITITASAGPNGSISPSGEVIVNESADQSFTITPDTSYQIADVLVDGSSVGVVSAYTFTNVTQDYTIAVTFIEETSDVIEFEDPNLEQVVRETIGKPEGSLYLIDVIEIANLDAAKRGIESLEGIQCLQNLKYLNFGSNQISDISALLNLTNLKWLFFYDNQVSDISALSNLTSLQDLSFSDNQVSDISALSNLTSLQDLSFSGNQVSNIYALSNLTSLKELRFYYNQVSDISALSNLTSLQDLSFRGNQVSNIYALSNLTSLQCLWFENNQVSDISALSNLTSLQYLSFDDTQVSDISTLSNLTSLQDLSFGGTQVSDISALLNLTNLKWLFFYDNQVADISALINNTGFSSGDTICMGNNYLDLSEGSQNMKDIETLINRGVDVFY